jgi:glycosyltransferase involved in cell wall biosynthesis
MMTILSVQRRILLVGNHLSRHLGTRAVGEELAERLAKAGWTVITTSHRRYRLPRLFDMLRVSRSADCNVALIDVFSGRAFLWAELAGWILRRRGIPYVLTLHGGQLPEHAQRHPRRTRRLLGAAQAVTTPSSYLQEAMAAYRRDLLLLPNALEIDAYPFALRQQPRPVLVWLRAFHRVYNPELAARVVARLAKGRYDVRLLMVGPDKGDGSHARTRRAITELGITDRVEIVGAVPKAEVPSSLARGDIFLNTSDADNTPVSVIEAMACGLAVVSTDAGGLRHLLDDEEDALVVPCGDELAMTAAVERLLDEPGLAARLSTNARRKALRFDWLEILPQWEDLLVRSARELS